MTHIEFLVNKIFEENTKQGKTPLTIEELDQYFSNVECNKVLKELLIGLNIIEEKE